MKQVLSVCLFLFVVCYSNAQSKKYNPKLDGPFTSTKTIKVNGAYDMCEHVIEGALKKSPGVFFADWDAGFKAAFCKIRPYKDQCKKDRGAGGSHRSRYCK